MRAAYLEWLGTQRRSVPARERRGRLAQHPTLRHARAPGNTCLAALEHGGDGTVQRPLNDSKGCGGMMRTAPLGFLPAALGDATVFELGVAAAALTHGHPEGYLPAGAMAVFTRDALDGVEPAASASRVLQELQRWANSRATAVAIGAAVEAAASGAPSRARVAALGEGWVGEEALAVGLVCRRDGRQSCRVHRARRQPRRRLGFDRVHCGTTVRGPPRAGRAASGGGLPAGRT